MKRILQISLLAITLAICSTACLNKQASTSVTANVPKSTIVLAHIKDTTGLVADALKEGTDLEAKLAASGVIDKDIEPKIKQGLTDAKNTVDSFQKALTGYNTFDLSTKRAIIDFAVNALRFVDDLNANGVLKIKNPNSQATAAIILSGARFALDRLKTYVEAQEAVAQ